MPLTPHEPYLTPLYYCFPNLDLAKIFVRYGADPKHLSFLHCFFTYRPNFKYLEFLIKECKLDLEEEDVEGKTALILVYEEFRSE